MQKKYLTIDEQIEHLKEKNLSFIDLEKTKKILNQIGYYKIVNAYKIPFIDYSNNKNYFDGVCFEDLYNLYVFDFELKSIVFEYASQIEITFKSYISNLISEKYGVLFEDYLRKENFIADTGTNGEYSFEDMKNFIKKEIDKQLKNEHPSIRWYKDKYNNFPFWVVSNILTLGSVSRIYTKLKLEDQMKISKEYLLPFDYLSSFIIHVNRVRNICAHNAVLYRYKSINNIPQKVKRVKNQFEKLDIPLNTITGRFSYGTKDFLSTLIVFSLLLPSAEFQKFKNKLNALLIVLKAQLQPTFYNKILWEMGLPENWYLL